MAGNVATYRILQDEYFDRLRIADRDYDDWKRKFLSFKEASCGMPLRAGHWSDDWDFVRMEGDVQDHPGGVGDFATMTGLIVATNERSHNVLRPLMGDAAEVLRGHSHGLDIWVFNVVKRIDKRDIGDIDVRAVFRVQPVNLNVFCLTGFKDVVETSGLKGLRFVKVDPDYEFGMV